MERERRGENSSSNVRCCVRCAESKTVSFLAESSVCSAAQETCTEDVQLRGKLNWVQAQRGASSVVFSTWNESLMHTSFAVWSTQHILPHHLICLNPTVHRKSLTSGASAVREDVSMPWRLLFEGCITALFTESKVLTLICWQRLWHFCCLPFVSGLVPVRCSHSMTVLR